MKMALTDGMVRIIEADAIQKTIIKSWNQMRWIRGQQMYEGIASTELLNKLATGNWPGSSGRQKVRSSAGFVIFRSKSALSKARPVCGQNPR